MYRLRRMKDKLTQQPNLNNASINSGGLMEVESDTGMYL